MRLRADSGSVDFVNVHLDPSLTTAARHCVLRSVRSYIGYGDPVPTVAGGHWFFLAIDDSRLDIAEGERRDGSRIAAAFDSLFSVVAECYQEQHRFSIVFSEGCHSVYSRIDRWYFNLDP